MMDQPSRESNSRARLIRLLWRAFDLLWLSALAAYVLAGVDRVPFHGDESTQLFMSHDYAYLVQQHDLNRVRFDRDAFDDPKDEMELRLINGTVGKMVMGLAWDLAGLTVEDLNQQWEWGMEGPGDRWVEWHWNRTNDRMPSPALLHAGRISSSLMLVGAVWAIYAVAWLVMPQRDPRLARLAAMSASLIYLTHPNVLLNGRRAMMEGSLALFSALTVVAGLMLLRTLRDPAARPRTVWGWWLVLGVMAGTALSSKHPALLTVVPVYAVAVLGVPGTPGIPWLERWLARLGLPGFQITRPHVRRMIASALMMAVTFLLWNPAWWSLDPLVQVKVIERRSVLMAGQTRDMEMYNLAHHGIIDRAETLLGSMFWTGPQYAEVSEWYVWQRREIDKYEASGLAGRMGGPVWSVLGTMLLGAGLACTLDWRQRKELWMMLAWTAALVGGLFSTPVIWQRYYLPLQQAVSVLAGLGAAWLVYHIARRLRARTSSAPAAGPVTPP